MSIEGCKQSPNLKTWQVQSSKHLVAFRSLHGCKTSVKVGYAKRCVILFYLKGFSSSWQETRNKSWARTSNGWTVEASFLFRFSFHHHINHSPIKLLTFQIHLWFPPLTAALVQYIHQLTTASAWYNTSSVDYLESLCSRTYNCKY